MNTVEKTVTINSYMSKLKVEFNYSTIASTIQLLSAKRSKKNISLSMFSRKLGQKVCEGGEFKSEVLFN